MKKIISVLIAIIFCISFINSYAATDVKKLVDIQTWKATHGAKVYFVYTKNTPVVDIQVVFAAGSAYDGQQWGLASLVNNMLDEGTKNQTATQIADVFDNVGAIVSNNVDRDMSSVQLRSLSDEKYLMPAINEFIDVIAQTNFPENAFQRIKNQTLIAIKNNQQSASAMAANVFYEAVYGDQPYAHPVLGTANSIEAINRQDLENFYKQYYVAQNADIVIVGDISREQAQFISDRIGNALPAGKSAELKLAKSTDKAILKVVKFPAKQTMMVIGQLGIDRDNPYYFPLMVGNAIFGGLPFISNLFQQIRVQRGLTYDVYSNFDPLRYRGVFSIQLKVKPADTAQVLELIKTALNNFIEQGPTEQELKAAKESLIGSFPLNLASNENILSAVTTMAFYQRNLDYLDNYRTKIAGVTADQIKQAFRQTIDPAKLVVVIVGPGKS